MKRALIVIFLVLAWSCNSNPIKLDGVNSIRIMFNDEKQKNDTLIVTNPKQIEKLIGTLKQAKREPVKFIADYKIELISNDSIVTLLVKNKLLNIQGITYKLKEDIGKTIEEIGRSKQ